MDTMNRDEEILTMVRKFAADRDVDPATITPEAKLAEIGIDSLQAIDLIFMFEDKYRINIPVEDFHATTVAEAMDFLRALLPAPASSSAAD